MQRSSRMKILKAEKTYPSFPQITLSLLFSGQVKWLYDKCLFHMLRRQIEASSKPSPSPYTPWPCPATERKIKAALIMASNFSRITCGKMMKKIWVCLSPHVLCNRNLHVFVSYDMFHMKKLDYSGAIVKQNLLSYPGHFHANCNKGTAKRYKRSWSESFRAKRRPSLRFPFRPSDVFL